MTPVPFFKKIYSNNEPLRKNRRRTNWLIYIYLSIMLVAYSLYMVVPFFVLR
jgi:dolichol kinase